MTNNYPHELALGDVYFSPVPTVLFLAFFASVLTVSLLNALKLSRFFYLPSYVFIAFMILYTLLIDHFWIKF